jgi:hypothetical protein
MRISVGQPLAGDALDRECGPRGIVAAESDPVVVPEIELVQVPAKVRLTHMVVHAM